MRILVVDDEPVLAAAVSRGLTREGFDVDVASNGAEGLWRAREHHYAAIVLDLLMPGVNGFEVCRLLRAEGVTTPILVLTAKDGEYDEAEALDTGADDFLSKPFSFVVLVARLRALLRRVRAGAGDELKAGSLRLDTRRHRCWRGDVEVTLTPREFALLERLMRAPESACAKDLLLTEVWGPDYAGDGNVVEVYVGYLRRKLDAPFGARSIETVRGIGYRVTADA